MNRLDEYNKLQEELETTPFKLEYTTVRSLARWKKRRQQKLFLIPASSLLLISLLFITLVNASAAFAQAMKQIPVLSELAEAVAFSPSLKAAVENDYAQVLGLEQTKNDITMRIEYVIVDQKQVNVFYRLQSDRYTHLMDHSQITLASGEPFSGVANLSATSPEPDEGLRQTTFSFFTPEVPEEILFKSEVSSFQPVNDPNQGYELTKQADFEFHIHFDPDLMAPGEIITLNETFEMDGQKITLMSAEIYPLHVRLNFIDDPANTAWLKSMELTLSNESGQVLTDTGQGITASGSDTSFTATYYLNSDYFSQSKSLKLTIRGALWLDKDHERSKIDLAKQTVDWLPDGVVLEGIDQTDDGWTIRFLTSKRQDARTHQLFGWTYYDDEGLAHEIREWSTIDGVELNLQPMVRTTLRLTNYPGHIIYLEPMYSHITRLERPVQIRVK